MNIDLNISNFKSLVLFIFCLLKFTMINKILLYILNNETGTRRSVVKMTDVLRTRSTVITRVGSKERNAQPRSWRWSYSVQMYQCLQVYTILNVSSSTVEVSIIKTSGAIVVIHVCRAMQIHNVISVGCWWRPIKMTRVCTVHAQ